jgi:SAM-dependent methyltransferase
MNHGVSSTYPLNDTTATGAKIESLALAAQTEPFDSFWEGPEDDVEEGFAKFIQFYKVNYLPHMPENRDGHILVISCGPGYFVEMLRGQGYRHVVGIDSFPEKVAYAVGHGLDCRVARAFPFVARHEADFDAIACEQELNHLTKDETRHFLALVYRALKPGGRLIVHGLNGANPITGSEALAQNVDHFNTFTEYSLRRFSRPPASATSGCFRSICTSFTGIP